MLRHGLNAGYKARRRRRIWARDGGRCQLCGKRIDPALPPENPRSLTLDHIVPRSLGGTSVQSNLQATHRRCNGRRNDDILVRFPREVWGGRLLPIVEPMEG